MTTSWPMQTLRASTAMLALGSSVAQPQTDGTRPEPRVWMQVSAYRPSEDSRFRLDRTGGALNGTEIDGERDLGLASNKTMPALLLGLRLSERWRTEFEYLALDRSRSSSVANIGGLRFGGGRFNADIDARVRIQSYRLSVGYSVFQVPGQGEAGLLAGVHVSDFQVGVRGAAIVKKQPVGAFSEQRQETLAGPTLGGFGRYRLGSHWELDGRAEFSKLHYLGYQGRILNLQANVLHHLTPQIGLGLGWRRDELRIQNAEPKVVRSLRYRFEGPQLFLRASF